MVAEHGGNPERTKIIRFISWMEKDVNVLVTACVAVQPMAALRDIEEFVSTALRTSTSVWREAGIKPGSIAAHPVVMQHLTLSLSGPRSPFKEDWVSVTQRDAFVALLTCMTDWQYHGRQIQWAGDVLARIAGQLGCAQNELPLPQVLPREKDIGFCITHLARARRDLQEAVQQAKATARSVLTQKIERDVALENEKLKAAGRDQIHVLKKRLAALVLSPSVLAALTGASPEIVGLVVQGALAMPDTRAAHRLLGVRQGVSGCVVRDIVLNAVLSLSALVVRAARKTFDKTRDTADSDDDEAFLSAVQTAQTHAHAYSHASEHSVRSAGGTGLNPAAVSEDDVRVMVASCVREVSKNSDPRFVQLLAVESRSCVALGIARFEEAGRGSFGAWLAEHEEVVADLPVLRASTASSVRAPVVREAELGALAIAVLARSGDATVDDAAVALDDAVNHHFGVRCGCLPLGHGSAHELLALAQRTPTSSMRGSVAVLAAMRAPIGFAAVSAATAAREKKHGFDVALARHAVAAVPLLANVREKVAWDAVFEGDLGDLGDFLRGMPGPLQFVDAGSRVYIRVANTSSRPLEDVDGAARTGDAISLSAILCGIAAFEPGRLVAASAAASGTLSALSDDENAKCCLVVDVLRTAPLSLRLYALRPFLACCLRALSVTLADVARCVGARDFIEVVVPLCDPDDVSESAALNLSLLGRSADVSYSDLPPGAGAAAAVGASDRRAPAILLSGEGRLAAAAGISSSYSLRESDEESDGGDDADDSCASNRVPKSRDEANAIVASAQAIYAEDNEHTKQLLNMIEHMMPHLSTSLYTDTRCVYEVLQNADDARCVLPPVKRCVPCAIGLVMLCRALQVQQ